MNELEEARRRVARAMSKIRGVGPLYGLGDRVTLDGREGIVSGRSKPIGEMWRYDVTIEPHRTDCNVIEGRLNDAQNNNG